LLFTLRDSQRSLGIAHGGIRHRGLPGWVDEIDDKAQTVTITFFSNVDSKLFDELTMTDSKMVG
jgi:hypothetical protein